ncbi:MAG: hypothetical protein BWY78_01302 [Alphaproteobacteria bacterium ADurb.Bin438]|nr:MAG: hypothetical protein BWY78_01302 [Alphaproteobacteria bacterium ADurb.Bin438]
MQSTIKNIRFVLLIISVFLFPKLSYCQNFYFGEQAPVVNQENKNLNKKTYVRNVSKDYYVFKTEDYSNTYCPKGEAKVLERKIPKYQDDHAIFDVRENKNLKCKDVYYPYNYTVPK